MHTTPSAATLALFFSLLTPGLSNAQGSWGSPQKLVAFDAAPGDVFLSPAIDGNTLIVGAESADLVGAANAGAAYVFELSGTTWVTGPKLTASVSQVDAGFGYRAAISGDTAVVGAWLEDAGVFDSGAAYVFERSGTLWNQAARITPSAAWYEGKFGSSVAIEGDTILVGAPGTGIAAVDGGCVYVFERNAGGPNSWGETALLTANAASAFEALGEAVAIEGDFFVAGATGNNFLGTSPWGHGSAYVFRRAGGVWSEETMLIASNASSGDYFGWSVDISGDTVVVGAPEEEDPGANDTGSAYVFVRDAGGSWTEEANIEHCDAVDQDGFGNSVSIVGDTIVAGSPEEGVPGPGSAYIFVRDMGVWSLQARVRAFDGMDGDAFGCCVASAAGRVVIGAPEHDSASIDAGAAYVLEFSGSGPLDLGSSYCSTSPNSAGTGAIISATGSTSVTDNDLTLRADGTPVGEPGIFYYGPNQIQAPFGDGYRCVGGSAGTVVRIFPFALGDTNGTMTVSVNNTLPAHAQVAAGANLNFQCWFRDPAAGGTGFNLSDGLEIPFCP